MFFHLMIISQTDVDLQKEYGQLIVLFATAGIPYMLSKSRRPAICTRDPDANAMKFT